MSPSLKTPPCGISRDHRTSRLEDLRLRVSQRKRLEVVGQRLQDVLASLRGKVIDMEVELRFSRREYNGVSSPARARFRLVGVRNPETGDYHLCVTNIPVDKLSADDVARVYTARWFSSPVAADRANSATG